MPWYSSKQSWLWVKQRWTLHFEQITLDVPLQPWRLHLPRLVHHFGQWHTPSVRVSSATQGQILRRFGVRLVSAGRPLFFSLLLFSPLQNKELASCNLNSCKRMSFLPLESRSPFWALVFLYNSHALTTATSKRWKNILWYHFFKRRRDWYSPISESNKSTPPKCHGLCGRHQHVD